MLLNGYCGIDGTGVFCPVHISLHALELLRVSGLHGHKYAIDAVVAATAPRSTKPVMVLTSAEDDMLKLCGKVVRVVSV
ncbi:MAG TPA: hypothetical protein VM347_04480 [Nonomuraea sp.]|nr:hypothetical protein [Nonomuraea sp.]